MKEIERLRQCLEAVRAKTDFVPDVALVLGSGLGGFADTVKIEAIVDYKDIPGFPRSTVLGHKGRFLFGYVGDVKTVIMDGRVHYYEGYPTKDVVLPTRLMKLMGAKALFLTNASGGINKAFSAGDLMLITDHISNFVPNPLIGENIDELGVRFPDMSHIYDLELSAAIENSAEKIGTKLQKGVYIQLTGPSYESPAEIRMAAALGADAVGMSTVPEVIVAHHCGIKVFGISIITDLGGFDVPVAVSHEEVQVAANNAQPKMTEIMREMIRRSK